MSINGRRPRRAAGWIVKFFALHSSFFLLPCNPPVLMLYFTRFDPLDAYRAMLDDYFRQYGLIAVFTAVAVAIPTGMLVMSWLLSLIRGPTPKARSYQAEHIRVWIRDPVGDMAPLQFQVLHLRTDFSLYSTLRWSSSSPGPPASVCYPGITAVSYCWRWGSSSPSFWSGWLYAWRKGALEWS